MSTKDTIVVGIDGSEGGRRALRWALGEAARTGGAVEAVTAWHWEHADGLAPVVVTPMQQRDQATELLAAELAEMLPASAGPQPVTRHVIEGLPGRVLADAARDARMLVIGSHGHSRLFHAVLGSVSEECVRRAQCPVVVIPLTTPATTPATG